MPHIFSPRPPNPPLTQSSATNNTTQNLTPEEQSHLENLLAFKFRDIPTGHIPTISLRDILHASPRTCLPHIPHDINLAFFLRNRAVINRCTGRAKKEDSEQDVNVARATWFYRLDPTRQFQRWHDSMRWNLALFTALLAQHTLNQDRESTAHQTHNDDTQSRRGRRNTAVALDLAPACVKFIIAYLWAVLEHHNSPTVFSARESFIRVWRNTTLDLFTIHRSWAKKALQREMKRLSKEWERELSYTRREMSPSEYSARIDKFVGSVVPGRADQTRITTGRTEKRRVGGGDGGGDGGARTEERTELLDALRTPCPLVTPGVGESRVLEDGEDTMVCDLRTAITCVQSMRPRDTLPVLMRLSPPGENGI